MFCQAGADGNAKMKAIVINMRLLSGGVGLRLMPQDGSVLSVPSTKWRQAGHPNTSTQGEKVIITGSLTASVRLSSGTCTCQICSPISNAALATRERD